LFLKRLKFGRAFVWPEHELLDHTLEDNPVFDTLILRYQGPRAL
jgi:hypothetical protein